MSMSNRELTTLARHSKSNEELAEAIKSGKGKELAEENDRAEKIAGGKKMLAQADKVLALAEKHYGERLVSARVDIAKEAADAEAKINADSAALLDRARVLDNDRANLDQRKAALDEQDAALVLASIAAADREIAAEARQMEQDKRDSELRTREAVASESETARAEYDKWQAARP